jgi:Na+/proline symporter
MQVLLGQALSGQGTPATLSATLILACFFGYFALLLFIAWLTTRRQTENLSDFFVAGRRAPWYVVAYGMVGTSISGITFVSVPGAVLNQQMGYMQVVLGYLAGYAVIALVLLPLYYRLQLTSIYSYLEQRLGFWGYKMGAVFFLLSRSTGTAVRLYLMALVLQYLLFDRLGVPFAATVAFILLQILIYTGRGGMKTILWTDTLQSTSLIAAVVVTMVIVMRALHVADLPQTVFDSPYGTMFFGDWKAPNHFVKEFLAGAFICIVMTGLDQAQMQKNLACKNLRQAQWNMASYSLALVLVNFFFVCLGVLLYLYAQQFNIALPAKTDQLYPMLALNYFGPLVAVLFMLGLTAAAYSSADDALTALTTSICVDILGVQKHTESRADIRTKRWVHAGVTLAIFLLILGFRELEHIQSKDFSTISLVLKMASYTYGPLLGMFAFGIFTTRTVRDGLLPFICIAAPLICAVLEWQRDAWFGGFQFGNGLILLNGFIVFAGAWAASKPRVPQPVAT